MPILRIALRLIPAVFMLLGLVALLELAFEQLQAELDYQTALQTRGIERIENAYLAKQLKPNNYDYNRLLAIGYDDAGYKGQVRESHLAKLKLRPSWPFAWFDIARWQVSNGGYDSAEYQLALKTSIHLGENESYLRRARARQAIQLLDKVDDPALIALLQGALQSEYQDDPLYIFARAALSANEDTVCRQLKGSDGVAKWCKEMAYYRRVCAPQLVKLQARREWCREIRSVWKSRV